MLEKGQNERKSKMERLEDGQLVVRPSMRRQRQLLGELRPNADTKGVEVPSCPWLLYTPIKDVEIYGCNFEGMDRNLGTTASFCLGSARSSLCSG